MTHWDQISHGVSIVVSSPAQSTNHGTSRTFPRAGFRLVAGLVEECLCEVTNSPDVTAEVLVCEWERSYGIKENYGKTQTQRNATYLKFQRNTAAFVHRLCKNRHVRCDRILRNVLHSYGQLGPPLRVPCPNGCRSLSAVLLDLSRWSSLGGSWGNAPSFHTNVRPMSVPRKWFGRFEDQSCEGNWDFERHNWLLGVGYGQPLHSTVV